MGTFIVLAIVILGAGLAGRAMWKDHKAGKHCAGCAGCPGHCGSGCHCHDHHTA